jgi:hypothetical protein
MSDELNQFENDQAILLMYLADELSAEARAEVEGRLAEDGKLREELESLRVAQGLIWAGLTELDRSTRPPVPESVGERRAGRLVREWAEAAEKLPAPIPLPRRQVAWVRLSLAAAALLLVGFFLWPGSSSTNMAIKKLPSDSTSDVADAPSTEPSQDEEMSMLNDSFGANSALGDDASMIRVAAVTSSNSVVDLPVGNQ